MVIRFQELHYYYRSGSCFPGFDLVRWSCRRNGWTWGFFPAPVHFGNPTPL